MICEIIKQSPDGESVLPPSEPLDDLDDLQNAEGRSRLTVVNSGRRLLPLQVGVKDSRKSATLSRNVADL